MKIRKGDRVKVIAGRSKGKVGDVLRVLPSEDRVVVSGV
ncbi:MAG: 50S ribosomal protein L24, partial [Alphaproteobacteria bacterium]